ncbi:VOC family protein [Clostridium sp. HV4-5-A1G]|uniref:VOC family protein n=1 Tax=Clostridium sp. HV4-5-A1G TaxID=2004595 RepID=UPI00123B06BA|nr:VOC family protein [Clostridium sp. HV4-5-A1G]KAA8679074.1 VOC family protein [Clostridium sp. HV4-5-A1G]
MRKLKDFGIEHVGFVVRDLDKSIDHFKNFYGIEEFQIYYFSPTRAWSYGKEIKNYKLKIAMCNVNGISSGIEIIQPISGDGVHKDFIESNNNGLHHIAFKVDDYDYWREYFLKRGSRLVFESETEDELNGYRRCFYANDEENNMVYEIKEIAHFRK